MSMRDRGDETLTRGARPHRRVMLVVAQVSSMKTRRGLGSGLDWPVRQITRAAAMSGRCCSAA